MRNMESLIPKIFNGKKMLRIYYIVARYKLQDQGHRVKNNSTHKKVLSQWILMWNIKALALTVQKLLAKLKFQRWRTEWQN